MIRILDWTGEEQTQKSKRNAYLKTSVQFGWWKKNAIEMENTASNPLIFNHLNWNHQKYFKNAFKFVQKQNLLNFPDFQNDLISTKPFSATARNSRLQQSPLIELGITLPCKVEDFSVVEMQNDFGFATQQVTKANFHKNDQFWKRSILKWMFFENYHWRNEL